MGAMESQITSLMIVYSTVYSGADQGKHESSVLPAFVRGIHRWSAKALMFSLICAWINGWVNNREADDLRRHRAHYDVIEMYCISFLRWWLDGLNPCWKLFGWIDERSQHPSLTLSRQIRFSKDCGPKSSQFRIKHDIIFTWRDAPRSDVAIYIQFNNGGAYYVVRTLVECRSYSATGTPMLAWHTI